MLKNSFDLRISGGHELCNIPLTAGFTFVGKNGAQCIPLREGLPVSLQSAQLIHKETPTYSRTCLIAGAGGPPHRRPWSSNRWSQLQQPIAGSNPKHSLVAVPLDDCSLNWTLLKLPKRLMLPVAAAAAQQPATRD